MAKTDRPNRDALSDALDIYRDAMRPFIVRYLKQVKGRRVEEVISNSLNDRQAEQFRQTLAQGNSVEDAIDINDFPNLVSRQWHAVFGRVFKEDKTVQSLLWMIVTVRKRSRASEHAGHGRRIRPEPLVRHCRRARAHQRI